MLLMKTEVKSYVKLLDEYITRMEPVLDPIKFVFKGVEDKDVYNITAPFLDEDELVIAGRVESQDSEHSHIMFFVQRNGEWRVRENAPTFELQDPFFTFIDGELLLGGVEIYPHPFPTKENIYGWKTVIYKGAGINKLKLFFTGPEGMKDIRLVQLQDGQIGVLTRPQGVKGGFGKIGFGRIPSLADLTIEFIDNVSLLEGQFIDTEWGGANEAQLLANGWIGVLGHIGYYDELHNRHYCPLIFVLDPETGAHSDMELIAVRSKFLPGKAKRPDLVDVVFSGGLVRKSDGTAELYVGVCDAEAHRIMITDPFRKFEKLEVTSRITTYRYEENPLLTPADIKPHHPNYEVIGAFNAGIARYKGEILMLLRIAERPISLDSKIVFAPVYNIQTQKLDLIEFNRDDERYDFSDPRVIKDRTKSTSFAYLTSISYIRIARSKDGHHFTVDEKPLVYPSSEQETFGIEDPRVTQIDDMYYIYYSAVSPIGIGVKMISTNDFVNLKHLGMIFCPDNKDVVIFPEKVNGMYYALHRPTTKSIGAPEIWLAESTNLLHWGNHKHLIGLREGLWDNGRMGGGAVPIKTSQGWLVLYHGATPNHRYCMGAVLLDLNDPSHVIARSDKPILEPDAEYEKNGFFGDVVFSCGVVVDADIVKMYYGVADTSMACAELSLREIMESLTF
ncbi:MAG: glycosidase [Bacilli bacterium]|nr:glycosidase [Bacilli bacterium]